MFMSAGCKPAAPVEEVAEEESGLTFEKWTERGTPSGPRETTGLVLKKSGWEYKCMECHAAIDAKWHYDRPMTEHRDLELKHGTNSFCLNCHHPENRDAYVHYDGSEISSDDVELLCRKCHGPQYRDWEHDIHGRPNGYWNAALGEQNRLICTQCHDPHDPAFKPMKPMPAPSYPPRAAGKKDHPQDEEKEKGSHHG